MGRFLSSLAGCAWPLIGTTALRFYCFLKGCATDAVRRGHVLLLFLENLCKKYVLHDRLSVAEFVFLIFVSRSRSSFPPPLSFSILLPPSSCPRVRELRPVAGTKDVFDIRFREIRPVALEEAFLTHVFEKYSRLCKTEHVFDACVREIRPVALEGAFPTHLFEKYVRLL